MSRLFFSLFQNKPLLDETTTRWLFDCYAWALQQFDAQVFRDESRLVLPNDRFFPGRVSSIEEMASLIFDKVKHYAGVAHWPTDLLDARQCPVQNAQPLSINAAVRGSRAETVALQPDAAPLPVRYDPAMVNNPEAMIATLSHQIAYHMAAQATQPPPGGEPSLAQATEVLAVFLGFGVIFANSAFNVRIPCCGSCAPQPVDRQSYLSQYDTT
jgi:hypothetical protein